MFKNYPAIILCFFITNLSHAQKLIVLNSETRKIVSFASYFLFNETELLTGGYGSKDGILTLNNNTNFNKLTITCIGYENLDILKNQIINDTLLLTPTVYPLKEVLIKKKQKDTFTLLGYSKTKRKAWLSAFKGFKICTFIANPYAKMQLIHSFLFKIRNNNQHKLGFKLHLFEKDSLTNKPLKELLQQEIIIVLDGKSKEYVEHNVSMYNIEFPANGAFVGIEWFGVLNENDNQFSGVETQNGFIELNDVSENFDTFEQNVFMLSAWKNMENFKKQVKEYTNFKNCPTASFGIKVLKD